MASSGSSRIAEWTSSGNCRAIVHTPFRPAPPLSIALDRMVFSNPICDGLRAYRSIAANASRSARSICPANHACSDETMLADILRHPICMSHVALGCVCPTDFPPPAREFNTEGVQASSGYYHPNNIHCVDRRIRGLCAANIGEYLLSVKASIEAV